MGPKGQVLMTPSLSPEVQEQPAPPKQKKFSYSLSGVIGALPFFAFVAAFLIIPILTTVLKAFQNPAGTPSTASMTEAMRTGYRSAFALTFGLSTLTSVVGDVLGRVRAWAPTTSARPKWLMVLA